MALAGTKRHGGNPVNARAHRPPRFVFFDAGFTLLEPWPGVGFHYAGCARDWGAAASEVPDDASLDRGFRIAWKAVRAREAPGNPVPYGRAYREARSFWDDVVRETFRAAGGAAPEREEFFADIFERFAHAPCWRLYPDVAPALAMLRSAAIPWGILSNWDSRLHTVVAEFPGLAEAAAVVISAEAGAEKPAARIFEAGAAAARTRCAAGRAGAAGTDAPGPSDFALIGDEPEADGHGAIAAGWQQCLVLRDAGTRSGPRTAPPGLRHAATLDAAVAHLLHTSA